MLNDFVFQGTPTRVVFGHGTIARLGEEADRLGLSRLLVLCTPDQVSLAERIGAELGDRTVGLFSGATMHTPIDVTSRAVGTALSLGADGVVSVGGGSTTGLGKAIALRTDLPQIVIPTTYAGSEMTPILGETQGGRKTTQRSAKIQPEVVVYDVDLTLTLPPKMSALSAFNAVAHAVEALYAPDGNPIVSMMAEEGVRAIAGSVREVMHDPGNAHARAALLYGAWLCACCLGTTSMGLHHKLCHVLGGLFDLPHAQTHAIVLPYVLEYNAPSAPHAMDRLTRAFGTPHVVEYLLSLERECDIPLALGGIGMPHEGVRLAAEEAVTSSYSNPRSFDRESVTALLERAWAGSGV